MWVSTTIIVLLVCGLEGAPLSCPKSCTCSGTELHCKSFNFLQEISGDEATSITTLIVNNSTASTHPKFNALQNLKTLSLSSNKLKQFNSRYFPKNLETLDLSFNFITKLPKDLTSMVNLKVLRLTGNPISCTCDSILIRDRLLQNNVAIPTPVKCNSPANSYGKSWLTIACFDDLFSDMQGDAPYEGSGFETPVTESDVDTKNQDKSLEEEFIRVDSTTEHIKQNETKSEIENEEEGSGNIDSTTPLIEVDEDDKEDEEYDEPTVSETPMVRVNDWLLNKIPTCNFDCSTPPPSENDTDALPPLTVFEGAKILWDDFNILKSNETTTKTDEQVTVTQPSTNATVKNDSEIITNHIVEQDKESFVEETKQSNISTYIFLGGLLVVIIALVIYAVFKKRASKRNSHSLNKIEEKSHNVNEVELLKASKPSNGTHEVMPLINGHNDKEARPFEDVELRQKPNEAEEEVEENLNLLVPETKRVTIKASEIPNSTPKTPILVTRHLNSDGSIVTTPSVHNKA